MDALLDLVTGCVQTRLSRLAGAGSADSTSLPGRSERRVAAQSPNGQSSLPLYRAASHRQSQPHYPSRDSLQPREDSTLLVSRRSSVGEDDLSFVFQTDDLLSQE